MKGLFWLCGLSPAQKALLKSQKFLFRRKQTVKMTFPLTLSKSAWSHEYLGSSDIVEAWSSCLNPLRKCLKIKPEVCVPQSTGQKKCCLKTNGARRDKPSFSMEQSPNGLASRYNLHDKGRTRHTKSGRDVFIDVLCEPSGLLRLYNLGKVKMKQSVGALHKCCKGGQWTIYFILS